MIRKSTPSNHGLMGGPRLSEQIMLKS